MIRSFQLISRALKPIGILSVAALFSTGAAFASSPITANITGDTKLSGNCSSSNATTIVTNSLPKGSSDFFQLTFDEMTLEAAQENGKRRKFKDCTFEMEVELPRGYTIGELKVEYDGFMSLSAKSMGSIETLVTIPGLTNRSWNNTQYHSTRKKGPHDDDVKGRFVSNWGKLPGQRCPQKVKVFVDIFMDLTMSKKAEKGATSEMGLDVLSGLFEAPKANIGLVPCKRKPWWWWWF